MPPCIRVAKDALDATILRLCATLPDAIVSVSEQLLQLSKRSMAGQGGRAVHWLIPIPCPWRSIAVVLKLTMRVCCIVNNSNLVVFVVVIIE